MELFNNYKNKDIQFIVSHINNIIINDTPLKKSTFVNYIDNFKGYSELYNYIFDNNLSRGPKLFFADNTKIKNVTRTTVKLCDTDNSIPIRLTLSERAWIYHVLNNNKANLFMDDEKIHKLKESLLNIDDSFKPFPLSNNDIEIRKTHRANEHIYTPEEIIMFRKIMKAIKERRYITLTNNSFSGKVYENSKLIPFKIEYNYIQDTLSLTCYNDKYEPRTDSEEIVRIFFYNITHVEIGERYSKPENTYGKIKNKINLIKAKEVITLEIENNKNAIERAVNIFSAYNKKLYTSDNKILMDIKYYEDFQKDEIIRHILKLGKFAKVESPDDIKEIIKEHIMISIKNYNLLP